jgi:hypothetical protein
MELSKVEQRYRAVLAVQSGERIGEIADRFDVSRRSIHAWLVRHSETGLAGLTDRLDGCAHQASPEVEAAVCELRRGSRQHRARILRGSGPGRVGNTSPPGSPQSWPRPPSLFFVSLQGTEE